jgi:glyoxylase-like metal-dependent hydrolase (beta-lactamase superfamily II)/rhodanese-related sulfurtransferase
MPLSIEELNDTNCKTYLLSVDGHAALVDPVRERMETYRDQLRQRGLTLDAIIETHTHADHLMINRDIKLAFEAPVFMHRNSPIPLVDHHVSDGDVIDLGPIKFKVLDTPGHTPDSMCLVTDGAVLTGDTLLIQGSGRTDFPDGDAAAQYDAVTTKLFTLPDDTVVWPAHDYKGQTSSTIGKERDTNPRFAGKTKQEYVEIMANLGLPFPKRIQQVLQVNQSGFEQDEVGFPNVVEVTTVSEIEPAQLRGRLAGADAPVLLDVREPEEFIGELGHIPGSLLVPLDALEKRLPKLAGYVDRELIVVCRAGARSRTAAVILQNAGFRHVENLHGGMLAWNKAGLPVQR